MTTTKQPKDKFFAPAPKLMPRPTAASTARAALNATNRSLSANNTPPVVRTASNRGPISPNLKRRSSISHRETLGKIDPHMETEADTKNSHETFTRNTKIDDENSNEKDILQALERQQEPSNKTSDIHEKLHQDILVLSDNENSVNEHDSIALVSASSVSRPLSPKSPPKPENSTEPTRPSTPCGIVASARQNISRPATPQRQKNDPQPKTIAEASLPLYSGLQIETTPLPEEVTSNLSNDNAEMLLENDIKAAYTAKQKQFQQMKKELDLKQQSVLEVFDGLRSLGERLSQEGETGGGEGAMQELLLFHVADWPAEELTQLYRDVTIDPEGAAQLIESVAINERTLNDLEAKIQSVPNQFGELCLQALSARQELVDWVKELVHTDNPEENGEGEAAQRISLYNTQGLQLCEALHQLKERADGAVHTISCVSKRVWRDQNALIAVGKSLVRDIARLKQDLETQASVINEMRQHRAEAEPNALEETRQQLEEERAAKQVLMEKLALSETLLRQTKARITKMDRQLHEAEASITNLTGTVKTLEDQSRQREAQIEARARKLRESLKTGEMASGHLAQQRDALQAEVIELKDQIEKLTNQHKHTVKELKSQLKQTASALEELKQISQKRELELITERDTALAERHATVEKLEAKIMELERNVSDENGEQNCRATREMELIAELQATKVELHMAEDEIAVCKREKVRFLETLTNISDTENKLGMQQKLAAELLNKEDVIGKLRSQIRELCKNDKLLDQKVIQYEHYINGIRAHSTGTTSDNWNDSNQQDLQKEILNLRVKLLEAVHRNEELLESLAEKEQQLDQQDKTSRAQARVIKVREELINMLKSKETEQSRELSALQQDLENRMSIVDDVNKQIAAKAAEIQELFATLESKQQQIHRLEKIVLALEEQQRRAQAQRTRYEEKIASLEHELANGCRRERKFLFF